MTADSLLHPHTDSETDTDTETVPVPDEAELEETGVLGGPGGLGPVAAHRVSGTAGTAASVNGYGPVPSALARDLVLAAALRAEAARFESTARGSEAERVRVFLRRLFTDPVDARVTTIDTGRRLFTGALARFLRARDQTCRTPGCTAPIRHLDHVLAHRAGGTTSALNGQGLCEGCSYTKEAPGWTYRVVPPDPDHVTSPSVADDGADGAGQRTGVGGAGSYHCVVITTPTGHAYHSRPPPALGAAHVARPRRNLPVRPARRHNRSVLEHALATLHEQPQPP